MFTEECRSCSGASSSDESKVGSCQSTSSESTLKLPRRNGSLRADLLSSLMTSFRAKLFHKTRTFPCSCSVQLIYFSGPESYWVYNACINRCCCEGEGLTQPLKQQKKAKHVTYFSKAIGMNPTHLFVQEMLGSYILIYMVQTTLHSESCVFMPLLLRCSCLHKVQSNNKLHF